MTLGREARLFGFWYGAGAGIFRQQPGSDPGVPDIPGTVAGLGTNPIRATQLAGGQRWFSSADGAFYLFYPPAGAVVSFLPDQPDDGPAADWCVAILLGQSQLGMLPATAVYVNAGSQSRQYSRVSWRAYRITDAVGLFRPVSVCFHCWRKLAARRGCDAGAGWLSAYTPSAIASMTNLIVIGAGSAGLVASLIAATVKCQGDPDRKRDRMGGDCLNTGCVPSKALIRSAAHCGVRCGGPREFGLSSTATGGAWISPRVMERVQGGQSGESNPTIRWSGSRNWGLIALRGRGPHPFALGGRGQRAAPLSAPQYRDRQPGRARAYPPGTGARRRSTT